MCLAGFPGQEEPGAFNHDIDIDLVPFEFGRVLDRAQADLLAIDDQVVAGDRNLALETAMHGVVLEQIGEVVGFQQVVDRNDLDFRKILDCGTEHHAPDATESIDTDTNCHLLLP
jgi:hypothetical protein